MSGFNDAKWRRKVRSKKSILEDAELAKWSDSKKGMDSPQDRVTSEDLEYFSDQLNDIIQLIMDYHQDVGSAIEMAFDESGIMTYQQMEQQISRYINGSRAQLENLQKYLERQKTKV